MTRPRSPQEQLTSAQALERAQKSVAKGASSTMRVLDYHIPLVIERAEGARVWDVEGNSYIDMNMGYGPLIFGHRPALLADAIRRELEQRGTTLGFVHRLSHQVAELVKKSFPSIDLLRFCSTGTEAAQTAVRLARACTGRPRLVVFEGHYHGSGEATFHRYHAPADALDRAGGQHPIPGTAGMAPNALQAVSVLPWNDIDSLRGLLASEGETVAGILMEPVMGNAGVIPPRPGYLQAVREAANACGAVLIFDEVITGFRVARGGAQERYGVTADITMLSKAMNGGVPLGAVGGKRRIMQLLVEGEVFHGGVYSGNPMCMAAALAVQQEYERDPAAVYGHLERVTARLADGLRGIFAAAGVPVVVQHLGAMLSCWFTREDASAPGNYREVLESADPQRSIRFQHAAQRAGVYFHPNMFEPWYISTAHTEAIIDEALERLARAAGEVDWTD